MRYPWMWLTLGLKLFGGGLLRQYVGSVVEHDPALCMLGRGGMPNDLSLASPFKGCNSSWTIMGCICHPVIFCRK